MKEKCNEFSCIIDLQLHMSSFIWNDILSFSHWSSNIIELFALCKGYNLGVVRLIHLLNKGNQVLFIIL